jgi:hypothetical protein
MSTTITTIAMADPGRGRGAVGEPAHPIDFKKIIFSHSFYQRFYE